MNEYILEMKHISKSFRNFEALNDVNFRVRRGEIHAIVGENGSGKSTLMNILSGVFNKYSGDIVIDGEFKKFKNISDNIKSGIFIVHQELSLFPELSVYENIFFGNEIRKASAIDWNETVKRAKELLEIVNLDVDTGVKVKSLGFAQRQLVEIAKALANDVKILILDEPMAVLNETYSRRLIELLKNLKDRGITCILISHRIRTVVTIADSITVLKDGTNICTIDNKDKAVEPDKIALYMLGKSLNSFYPKRSNCVSDEVVFEIESWNVFHSHTSKQLLKDVNLNVKKGEIIGISGLIGSGRSSLALTLFGNPKKHKIVGNAYLNGEKYYSNSVRKAIDQGMFYVSEDRRKNSLFLFQDVKTNISVSKLSSISKNILVKENQEVNTANYYIKKFNMKEVSPEQLLIGVSGGNQQKVAFAKGLSMNPKVLILDEPTKGIDVGAKHEIYLLMNMLVKNGLSIILVSSDLAEVIAMSDRIYSFKSGQIVGETKHSDATEERIIDLAVN